MHGQRAFYPGIFCSHSVYFLVPGTILIVIPARLAAVRLPNKPLRLLGGEPLIARVYQRVAAMEAADRVVVATDEPTVAQAVQKSGGEAVITAATHTSGTERVAEVARMAQFQGYDTIVNVQGDEPFMGPQAVRAAAELVSSGRFPLGTAAVPAKPEIFETPSIVKVVTALDGAAMYFSRAPIPFLRDEVDAPKREALTLQHLGVYAYSRAALERWVALKPHPLEEVEKLEQLRPLADGIRMGVAVVAEHPESGIDTEEDLARANARWESWINKMFQNGNPRGVDYHFETSPKENRI